MPKIYFAHDFTGDVETTGDLQTLADFCCINFDPDQKMAFLWIDDEVVIPNHGRAFIAWDEAPTMQWGPDDPKPQWLTFKQPEDSSDKAPGHGWTCFHCGETFTNYGSAEYHFGSRPEATAACRIKLGGERGLVMALRKLERRLFEETGEIPSALRSDVDDAMVDWAVDEVNEEMIRQKRLYPHSDQHTGESWTAILMEEVGEVADATERPGDLFDELIQVAAVAMSCYVADAPEDKLVDDLAYHLAGQLRLHRDSDLVWLKELISHAGEAARSVNNDKPVDPNSLLRLAAIAAAWACELTVPA